MGLNVDIHKKLGSFSLDMSFQTAQRLTGILGASGCGKSMTLKAIAGITEPDEGRIELNGRVLYDSERKINLPSQKRNVGYLFQNYALFPNMTVLQNIACGLKYWKRGNRERSQAAAQEMIELFGLQGLENHLPRQLSGGQQQRTALARILVCQPDAILLDEPFSALDSYLKDRLQDELLQYLQDYGGLILMVSHSRDELYRFSDDLIVMGSGCRLVQGTPQEVFRNPGTESAAVLTGCKNFSAVGRISDHSFYAADWGTWLHTTYELPPHFAKVGFRAHDFIPVYGARQENCIPCRVIRETELPFEKNYYIAPDDGSSQDIENSREGTKSYLTWRVQRDGQAEIQRKGMPDYLRFPEEQLLFLTS
ncbi:MAG: ATP-binding cassette domain-containing protein [Lachnospiraceae bacterium]|nr:ATP-binding cassette domain-containing protein [Lachnospiraceae bacterium]